MIPDGPAGEVTRVCGAKSVASVGVSFDTFLGSSIQQGSAQVNMSSQPAVSLDQKGLFYMFLLALQFGTQPTLTRRYTSEGICRSTVILAQEVLKFFLAFVMLTLSGSRKVAFSGTLDYCQLDTFGLCCWPILLSLFCSP